MAYEVISQQGDFQPTLRMFGEIGPEWVNDPVNLTFAENDQWNVSRSIGIEAELVLFDGYRRANLLHAGAARVDGNIYRLLDASETMAPNATEVYINGFLHRELAQAVALLHKSRAGFIL